MKMVLQPAAWPQSTSRQRSPTIQLCARSMPSSRAARSNMPGFGLRQSQSDSAFAGMKTNFHAVNRQLRQHVRVNFFDHFLFQSAAANIRLVGGHDQQKSGGLQFCARGGNVGKNFKLGQTRRRIRLASRSSARLMTPSRSRKTARRISAFRFPLSAFISWFPIWSAPLSISDARRTNAR